MRTKSFGHSWRLFNRLKNGNMDINARGQNGKSAPYIWTNVLEETLVISVQSPSPAIRAQSCPWYLMHLVPVYRVVRVSAYACDCFLWSCDQNKYVNPPYFRSAFSAAYSAICSVLVKCPCSSFHASCDQDPWTANLGLFLFHSGPQTSTSHVFTLLLLMLWR